MINPSRFNNSFRSSALVLSLATVSSILLSGCGGTTYTPMTASISPFAGHYLGTYTAPTNSASGTSDLTIANDGTVTGTGTLPSLGLTFGFTGSITNAGVLTGNVTGANPQTLSGTLTLTQTNHLVGPITASSSNGVFVVDNYDLVKQ